MKNRCLLKRVLLPLRNSLGGWRFVTDLSQPSVPLASVPTSVMWGGRQAAPLPAGDEGPVSDTPGRADWGPQAPGPEEPTLGSRRRLWGSWPDGPTEKPLG